MCFQNVAYGLDSVPIAGSGGNAEMFLNHGVGIGLAEPTDAHCKSAGDGNDADFPFRAGRLLNRKFRFCAWRVPQHAHEPAEALGGGRAAEPISARQREQFAPRTDHQFGFKGQPAHDFFAQLPLAHVLSHHQRSGRANIDDAELVQVFGQFAGLEHLMSTHVDGPEENNG